MKYYVDDWNGVLTDFKEKVKNHLATPRDADVWVMWQDLNVTGFGRLIETAKKYLPKPTYCVQHGRGATRDYGRTEAGNPDAYKLNADRFLCWGKTDYDRMCSFGYKERTTIVGCPLNPKIQPRIPGPDKKVLFVPVNANGKEHPENLNVYYELIKMKYSKAQEVLMQNKEALHEQWGFNGKEKVSFSELNQNMEVITKLLHWHDKPLYHGAVVTGFQDTAKNNETIFKLLRNVDVVVGLDQCTTETFALAHDVPVIIVKGFNFKSGLPVTASKAVTYVDFCDLEEAVNYALAHPEHLRQERAEEAELELGLSYGNPTNNIFKIIKEDAAKGFKFL